MSQLLEIDGPGNLDLKNNYLCLFVLIEADKIFNSSFIVLPIDTNSSAISVKKNEPVTPAAQKPL